MKTPSNTSLDKREHPRAPTGSPQRSSAERSGQGPQASVVGNQAMQRRHRTLPGGGAWPAYSEPLAAAMRSAGEAAPVSMGSTRARELSHHLLRASPGRPLGVHEAPLAERSWAASVRVHEDPAAQASAIAAGSRAYATGDNIVLGPGLGSRRGEVLRHELRHVRQMRNRRAGAPKASSQALESEAQAASGAPELGADPAELHGFWPIVAGLLAAGYILLDPDPANAPGPGDPVYRPKNPAQRVGEGILFALPAARLGVGGATMGTMALWGGGSAMGRQGLQDLGRGETSEWNEYAGEGLGGAVAWGLPMGPMRAFGQGTRGLPLFANFGGYGFATGVGLRASGDLGQWQLSPWQDYALWGGVGFGAGLLGATTVTGLDFVAQMAVTRSNAAISQSLSSSQSHTVAELQQLFGQRSDLAGRLGQSYLQSRSLYGAGQLHPRMGTANIGGGSETPQFSNVNPFMEGTGGPNAGVSNHVNATFGEIDQVFQAGTVQRIISYRLPASTVNWEASAQAAYRVLGNGGTVQINIWSNSAAATQEAVQAFRAAGFRQVTLGGTTQVGGQTFALPAEETGTAVIISAVK